MNLWQKIKYNQKAGANLEIYYSNLLQNKISNPNFLATLLIDPHCLRVMGCGQVDLCNIEYRSARALIVIYEIKRGSFISHKQWQRLGNSLQYLCEIMKLPGVIELKNQV